uniref:F-box/LRR-repeat protein 6 n=1 Tax=Plectus sambesii TaxID=2011161 RepID=A0A914W6M0_9BILA
MNQFVSAVISRMNQSGKKKKAIKKKASAEQLYESFVTKDDWASDDSDNSGYAAVKVRRTKKRPAFSSSSSSEESESNYDSDESDDANEPSSSRRKTKNGNKETAAKGKRGKATSVRSKKSPKKVEAKKSESNGRRSAPKRQRNGSSSTTTTVAEKASASNSTKLEIKSNNIILPPLPAEVWAKIFCYVIADVGTMPFLLRITRVGRVFRDAAWNKICWRDVRMDAQGLTRSRECLEHFSESFIGHHTRQLSLSHWEELTIEDLDMILYRTSRLTSLDISFCRKLEISEMLNCLKIRLPQLRSLDLTYVHEYFTQAKPIKADLLADYLKSEESANLRYLYLNGNYIGQLEKLLETASSWKCAGELQTLDMSGVNTGRSHSGKDGARVTQIAVHHCTRPVDLGILAKATPKLVTLRLAEVSLDYSATTLDENEKVWPLLENVDLACELLLSQSATMSAATNSSGNRPSYRVPGFSHLLQLFSGCRQLKDLTLNGIDGASDLLLLLDDDLPLQQLQLRRCRLMAYTDAETLRGKIEQYLPTLRELDFGWINEGSFENFLNSLFTEFTGEGQLMKVNLIGCPITTEALRALLDRNQHLEWIDLTSCRSVVRGCKRLHSGVADIRELRRSLRRI